MEFEMLDPRVDVIFKRIFGSEHNRDVLLAFLNSTFLEAGELPLTQRSQLQYAQKVRDDQYPGFQSPE